MDNPWDVQEGGGHYKKFKIQPAYFCYVNNIGFLVGNVIKYILRDKENKIEDLKKAKHYLELLIYEETRIDASRLEGRSLKPDLDRVIQESKQELHKSERELYGTRVVQPSPMDRGRTNQFQGMGIGFPTEILKDNKEESGSKCRVDNPKRGMEFKGKSCRVCASRVEYVFPLECSYWCPSCKEYKSESEVEIE